MSCECCWNASRRMDGVSDYGMVQREHEERGCVCTKNTPEGARARAGQFWDEARGVDTRAEAK